MIEFPKMLYRERNLPNPDIGEIRRGCRTVNSTDEQGEAVREGWIVELRDAVARVERTDKRAAWWKQKKEWWKTGNGY